MPYVLTADHCLLGNLANWVFQYQYWSETCTPNSDWSEDVQFNGCTLRANNCELDFALVQMNQTPASNSGINYAGWSRSTTPATSGASLHHPRGDLMKVSLFNTQATSVAWEDPNSPCPSQTSNHWRVSFSDGIIQYGSSGAALFDQNHRVVGQLHGYQDNICGNPGTNECWCTTQIPSIGEYGRFDLSWTGGGTNATRLSNWLDPTNTGVTTTNTTNISNLDPVDFTHVTMTGDATICGSAKTYSLSGSLSGLSVSWSASNGYITLSGSGSSITATPASGANGFVTLTATIGAVGCQTNNVKTKVIHVGNPVVGFNIESYPYEEPSCYSEWGIYTYRATVAWGSGSTGYEWGYRLIGSPPDVISPYDSPYFTFIPEQTGTYEIFVRPKNACGVGSPETTKEIEVVYSCPLRLAAPGRPKPILFPNPVKGDEVTVLLDGNGKGFPADRSKSVSGRIRIESLDGRLLSETAFDVHAGQVKLNVAKLRSGIYIVRIIRGTEMDTQKLVVQK